MADLLFCDLRRRRREENLEPELSVKSTISQTKSCVLVTSFDESLFYLLPILLPVISVTILNGITPYRLTAPPSSSNCPQVLRQWKFPTSYRRHLRCVHRFQSNYRCVSGFNRKTTPLYQVAFDERRMCHN